MLKMSAKLQIVGGCMGFHMIFIVRDDNDFQNKTHGIPFNNTSKHLPLLVHTYTYTRWTCVCEVTMPGELVLSQNLNRNTPSILSAGKRGKT